MAQRRSQYVSARARAMMLWDRVSGRGMGYCFDPCYRSGMSYHGDMMASERLQGWQGRCQRWMGLSELGTDKRRYKDGGEVCLLKEKGGGVVEMVWKGWRDCLAWMRRFHL